MRDVMPNCDHTPAPRDCQSETPASPAAGLAFDPTPHAYTINGRRVPSVTQIIEDQLPGWKAEEWYMKRGNCVHGAAAMIAKGQTFTLDLSNQIPEHRAGIEGRIAAVRKWFADCKPTVLGVEQQVYSERYQFAGRYDLGCHLPAVCGPMLIDWKSTLDNRWPLQLAGYAEAMDAGKNLLGAAVELHDDGSYKMSEPVLLAPWRRKFLALRQAWGVREELGYHKQEDGQ